MEKVKKHWTKKRVISLAIALAMLSSGPYVGVKNFQYYGKIENAKYDLVKADNKFVKILSAEGIKDVILTSVGNSVGFGFSIKDECIPFLERNANLMTLFKENNINYECHQFARMQDNNDEHTYEMLIGDVKESELNKLVRGDYGYNKKLFKSNYITTEDMEKDYPLSLDNDKSLNEIALSGSEQKLNIIIYNGGTGSFLDCMTRNERSPLGSFSRDASFVKNFFEYIYLKNPNTQIYFCGIPNFFNLDLVNIVNNRYKDMALQYPNVTYVEPSPVKVFYQTADGQKVDLHPNNDEYLCLEDYTINTICDNFVANKVTIGLDTAMKDLNKQTFFNLKLRSNEKAIRMIIDSVMQKYKNSDSKEVIQGLNKFINIYKLKYGFDFYYESEDIVLSILNEYINSYSDMKLVKK